MNTEPDITHDQPVAYCIHRCTKEHGHQWMQNWDGQNLTVTSHREDALLFNPPGATEMLSFLHHGLQLKGFKCILTSALPLH